MYVLNENILTHMSNFLNNKDLFILSRTSCTWKHAFYHVKKDRILTMKHKIFTDHVCQNSCPCLLERYYQTMFSDFKLKRYLCNSINGNDIPKWLEKYIK